MARQGETAVSGKAVQRTACRCIQKGSIAERGPCHSLLQQGDVVRPHLAKRHSTAAVLAVILLLFNSCHEENRGTVIARVGTAELTRTEALAHIDTSAGGIDHQLNAYVASWVNAELMGQEAARLNMDAPGEIERRLQDVRKQLIQQMFLDRYVKADSVGIGDEHLQQYYGSHETEFLAREPMLKLRIAIFKSRDHASSFTTSYMKTSSWDTALTEPGLAPGIVRSSQPRFYSQHTLYPPELWKIATTLSMNDISFPVKISSGYAVVQLTGTAHEGKPLPFELVRDEIAQRIVVEQRRKKYDDLLGTLRKRYTVEVFTGTFRESDTTHLQTHE